MPLNFGALTLQIQVCPNSDYTMHIKPTESGYDELHFASYTGM